MSKRKSGSDYYIVSFNESTLENKLTFKTNQLGDKYKFFTHGYEMFIIGEVCSDNWVADLTSGTFQKLPDCIDQYDVTGTLYHDRREMKCYIVGGKHPFNGHMATCNMLDIKNKAI